LRFREFGIDRCRQAWIVGVDVRGEAANSLADTEDQKFPEIL
jgi:hypothetical protein